MAISTELKSDVKITGKAPYKKRLEGINASPALYDLWKSAYSTHVTTKKDSSVEDSFRASATPSTKTEAIDVLRNAGDPSKIKRKKNKPAVVPIRVLQSIRLLLPLAGEESSSLDSALSSSASLQLAFTPPPPAPELTEERKKYLARMEKLRLKAEETKYTRITTNIKDQRQDDDKTAKSMTYAASVGINMIVAPISFGAFIYFFSGGVFDYLFPREEGDDEFDKNPTGVDIKRVILAVISGVGMMIIEMVLFVIRSHEFETHTTKKKKKRGVQPFGSYSANSAMTYTDGNLDRKINKTIDREDPAVKKNK
ncbi:unnamed protein product [Pseudo-nitzschia multistriata]|uniref:Uncharacterized protein n=1 Tax=Pseudo-nitzschia multistriata TaxID=183589 RepID=A0A448Z2V0_9STRA|nr:unnamed protein product [Pseudo-nitzschia multistriata]